MSEKVTLTFETTPVIASRLTRIYVSWLAETGEDAATPVSETSKDKAPPTEDSDLVISGHAETVSHDDIRNATEPQQISDEELTQLTIENLDSKRAEMVGFLDQHGAEKVTDLPQHLRPEYVRICKA